MSEGKDLFARLNELLKELPPSMAPAIEAARGQLLALHATNDSLSASLDTLEKRLGKTSSEVEALTEENESLRISLHLRELEVARLEGYRERVNEFDPVPELREYEDQLPAAARPPRLHDGAGLAMVNSHRTSHWFQRGRRA